jgi:hypothetical protein
MRTLVIVVLAAVAVSRVAASGTPAIDYPGEAPDQAVRASVQEPPKADIDIDVDKGSSRRDEGWYTHPTTIGLGILALLVIVALFAILHRGGGTTVVNP